MKYIDADKLKSIIKAQIKERKEWMKDINKSDRQDQLWSDLNGEDSAILSIITSLQQEQPEVELDREIIKYKVPFTDEREYLNETTLDAIARHFYKLGCKAKKYE